jgi:hypothetical protein
MQYFNPTRETIDLIGKGPAKDGVPPTESIAAGETKALDVDTEHPSNRALLAVLQQVGGNRKAPAKE